MAGDTTRKGKRRGKGRVEIESGFSSHPLPFEVCACSQVSWWKNFPVGYSPPPRYTVWYNFRILYFSWRVTVFLIINYLFNFNLCDGKELVAFNWELVTLGGCKRLRGRFPVLSSLNRELKMETVSGRRRPDWQRKPGTKAAVAPRQK